MPKYIFIYSDNMGSREEIKALLNNISEITDWRYDLPNSFFIQSGLNAKELGGLIKRQKPDSRYFLTEISSSNRQGWLPTSTWDFLKKKQDASQKSPSDNP